MIEPVSELIQSQSFFGDYGLSAAINETTYACRDATGQTLVILQEHLLKLCEMQRASLAPTSLVGV